MSIKWEIGLALRRYIRSKVNGEAQGSLDWAELHPGGCVGAGVCKCFKTAEVHVTYCTLTADMKYISGTWVFEGTLAALIQMLDAFDQMGPE